MSRREGVKSLQRGLEQLEQLLADPPADADPRWRSAVAHATVHLALARMAVDRLTARKPPSDVAAAALTRRVELALTHAGDFIERAASHAKRAADRLDDENEAADG